jgi:hypothetical protein
MRTGCLGPIGAVGQALEDTGPPPALAFALQPDAQAVAGRCVGYEDGMPLEMADAVAGEAEGRDLDLRLGSRSRR